MSRRLIESKDYDKCIFKCNPNYTDVWDYRIHNNNVILYKYYKLNIIKTCYRDILISGDSLLDVISLLRDAACELGQEVEKLGKETQKD